MVTPGTFGYIIGKKKRMMHVNDDADLLWQILVREIYVLMKHYKSIEQLKDAFEKIKVIQETKVPTQLQINQCKMFTNLASSNDQSWKSLLYFCQSSYINLLEVGYLLNEKEAYGYTFILDFNNGIVKYYNINTLQPHQKTKTNDSLIQTATLEEIMEFNDMPTKTYADILSEMKEQFTSFYDIFQQIQNEKEKITNLLTDAKNQGAVNIQEKLQILLEEELQKERKLHQSRRVFFQRLKALDLIEE